MRGGLVAFPTCPIASPKRESNKGMTKAVSNQEKIPSEMEVVLPHKLYMLNTVSLFTLLLLVTLFTLYSRYRLHWVVAGCTGLYLAVLGNYEHTLLF